MLDKELELCMHLAFAKAKSLGHPVMGVGHLVLAVLEDPSIRRVLKGCHIDATKLKEKLLAVLERPGELYAEPRSSIPYRGGIRPSEEFHRMLREAAYLAKLSGQGEVSCLHVLLASVGEAGGRVGALLREQHLSQGAVSQYLSLNRRAESKLSKEAERYAPRARPRSKKESAPSSIFRRGGPPSIEGELSAWLSNLTEEALEGRIEPLIGRTEEMRRILQILCRRKKNNPILLGEAGVGKSSIMEGLAYRLTQRGAPASLKRAQIFALDLAALLSGTKYRGDLERRFKQTVDWLLTVKPAILAIDEIHLVVGAGTSSGGQVDLANLLKPWLSSGKLRVLGATTCREYRMNFERDKALTRRFQPVHIREPTPEEALRILKGVQSRYEEYHGVRYDTSVLQAAVGWSSRYVPERALPDKAIDLLDELGSAAQLCRKRRSNRLLSVEDLEPLLRQVLQRPLFGIQNSELGKRLKSLEHELNEKVLGQEEAIRQLVQALKLSQAGLRFGLRPLGSLLLVGPPGVGKTELAKVTAEALELPLVRFNLAEYGERHAVSRLLGAPPGYVGHERGGALTEAVDRNPNAVILLDEIEKAHPELLHVFLQIMEEGWLTDHCERRACFRNCLLMMTSNLGSEHWEKGQVGFHQRGCQAEVSKVIQATLPPEFRSRLDQILYFRPLNRSAREKLLSRRIEEIKQALAGSGLRLEVCEEAQFGLLEPKSQECLGARGLLKRLQQELQVPLAELCLNHEFPPQTIIYYECQKNGGGFQFRAGSTVLEGSPSPSDSAPRLARSLPCKL